MFTTQIVTLVATALSAISFVQSQYPDYIPVDPFFPGGNYNYYYETTELPTLPPFTRPTPPSGRPPFTSPTPPPVTRPLPPVTRPPFTMPPLPPVTRPPFTMPPLPPVTRPSVSPPVQVPTNFTTSFEDEYTVDGFISSLWPNNEIPYEIEPTFSPEQQKVIEDTLKKISDRQACVTFRKRLLSDDNYLSFERYEDYCMSNFVGYADVGKQKVYLSPRCISFRFIYWVALQALGLPAEHLRPDRDDYIAVNWANIQPKYRDYFKKYAYIDPRISNLPYDYKSRLHYTNYMFSLGQRAKTVEAKMDPDVELGNILEPTEIDYRKVRALYC